MWALRISSPSKVMLVGSMRQPIWNRHILLDEHGEPVGIEPVQFQYSDGLLSFREAWTGDIYELATPQSGTE